MVEVDVDHRDPLGPVASESLRRDRCVVQIAVATEVVLARMVTGRPTQRERSGRVRAVRCGTHQALRRACDRGRFERGFPRTRSDRGLGCKGEVAEPAVDVLGLAMLHATSRETRWDHVAGLASPAPDVPCLGQERDECWVVDLVQRVDADGLGADGLAKAGFVERGDDVIPPLRTLEWRHQLAAIQLASGLMAAVNGAGDVGHHRCP